MSNKHKKPKELIQEYNERYGNIPLDQGDILTYLQNKFKKLDLDKVAQMVEYIESIPWEHEEYVIPIIPKPAARPRYSFETKHFYVPGSSTNKALMKEIIGISDNLICMRTKLSLEVYQPTPYYAMNQHEIYVAELGYIRPLIDPDVDNFAKAYLDAIQQVLIADDNIITDADIQKYFSIKPRIKLNLEYQTKFDSKYNEKVIMQRINGG